MTKYTFVLSSNIQKMTGLRTVIIATLFVVCHGAYYKLLEAGGSLAVVTDDKGNYQIIVNGQQWFASAPTYFQISGRRYSTSDGSLALHGISSGQGQDDIGDWVSVDYTYKAGSVPVIASIRSYADVPAIVFSQEFPEGAAGTNSSDRNSTSSGFPNFKVGASSEELGYLAYGGMHAGDMVKRFGVWDAKTFQVCAGLDGAPIVFFNKKSDGLFMTPFNQFMVGSPYHDTKNSSYNWGIMSTVKNYPPRYKYETILYYSPEGPREAISGWGVLMRRQYKKDTSYRDADFTNNYLAYWSDNGAYYVQYYVSDYLIQNLTYQQALLGTRDYAQKMNIPYRSYQYSVWYLVAGRSSGTVMWQPNPLMLPQGMDFLRENLGLSTAHNRWWHKSTPYAKQNGGPYNFVMDNMYAVPQDLKFWDDIFATSANWGIKNYMQDWLNAPIEYSDIVIEDVYKARAWLMQMGEGALKNDVTIQYCMSLGRHLLQSLEVPAVTQGRASDDYQPSSIKNGTYENWQIGMTSMFMDALGMAPFKDTFWTTEKQPDNYYNAYEPYPALQAVVSSLSAGPVGPGDMIGGTNVSLLMRCCNADGLILKPSRPAFPVNQQLQQSAFGGNIGPAGQVLTTYSDVGRYRFGVIFAAKMENTFSLGPTIAGFGKEFSSSVVYGYMDPPQTSLPAFNDTNQLKVTPHCDRVDFCLHYTTIKFLFKGSDLMLLGERAKWIPMSSKRFTLIEYDNSDFRIHLEGAVGENVDFHYIYGSNYNVISCTMPLSGLAWISIADAKCYPS